MRITSIETIQQLLATENNLSEALMTGLRLTNHGYSARLQFEVFIGADGNVIAEPFRIVFDLEAVQRMELVGALDEAMVRRPELINWGLSEIALVKLVEVGDGFRFIVQWFDERRVDIDCARVAATIDTARPSSPAL